MIDLSFTLVTDCLMIPNSCWPCDPLLNILLTLETEASDYEDAWDFKVLFGACFLVAIAILTLDL